MSEQPLHSVALRYGLMALSQPSVLLSLVFLAFILTWVYRLTYHPLARFPGPKIAACSSLYYTYYISKGHFPAQCEKLFKEYKTNVLRIAPSQIIFNDPNALKDITGRSDVWRGDFTFRVLGFTSKTVSGIRDPAVHKRKRRLMAPGFSYTALAAQEPHIVAPIVDKLIRKLKDMNGNAVDLSSWFDCTTGDVIGSLAFGANFGMLDQLEAHPFLHVLPNVLRLSVMAQCIPEVFKTLSWIYQRPFLKWAVPKPLRAVGDFAGYHIKERQKRDAEDVDQTGRKDIISTIEAGHDKYKDVEGYPTLTKDELMGEATVLVTGGGDTVATALTNTMFLLGQHPDVYQRLVSEIRETFPSAESILSGTAVKSIPYLDAVLNETMRVAPVLPGPSWRRNDHPISVAGHLIPAGTEMGAVRYCLFRNSDSFHEPDVFKPARWMEDMGDDLEASQPFGIGPRTCIGRNIAWMELRHIMCKLLWHFDWTPVTMTYQNPDYLVQYRAPMLMKARSRSVAEEEDS